MRDVNKGHLLFSPRFKEWIIFKSNGLNHLANWNVYDVKYAFKTIVLLTYIIVVKNIFQWDLFTTSQIHIILPCTFKCPSVNCQYAHHVMLYRTSFRAGIFLPLDKWFVVIFIVIGIFVNSWTQFITYHFRSDTSCNQCWWWRPSTGIIWWFIT